MMKGLEFRVRDDGYDRWLWVRVRDGGFSGETDMVDNWGLFHVLGKFAERLSEYPIVAANPPEFGEETSLYMRLEPRDGLGHLWLIVGIGDGLDHLVRVRLAVDYGDVQRLANVLRQLVHDNEDGVLTLDHLG